jgi:type VI secretion system protein ImpG
MSDQLYQYYEQELTYFSQMAAEFAQRYPKVAARLQLDEAKGSTDPHVERLIDAFALLTARVRRKIDDEFPEIVESLLNMLYPHYLRPVPPMGIAQYRFELQQTRPTEPASIPAGSQVTSRPSGGTECTFRTAYPVTLWPLRVAGASLVASASAKTGRIPPEASQVLRIQMETIGGLPFGPLKVPFLRFFLNGDTAPHHLLYELLFVHACEVQLLPRGAKGPEPVILEEGSIQPVGFEVEEGVLPYSDRSFLGYRLLQEYFHFPQKFFFFDLTGFNDRKLDGLGSSFDILIFFRDSELRDQMASIAQAVTGDTFHLGCTPVVNLFDLSAEPIRVSHSLTEYRVIPDRHRQSSMEVFSVEKVTSKPAYSEEPVVYQPFYSFRHSEPNQRCFWYAHRRPAMESAADTPRRIDDQGTEVYLSLVDLDFKPVTPPVELLSVRVKCTNRDFVSDLQWRKTWGEIRGEGLPSLEARCLVPPTPTERPPLDGNLQWRLISHLSLNHLSIAQGGGREALQEILRLYAFTDAEEINRRIAGIAGLKSEASVARVPFNTGVAFCRGLDVEVEFDEEQYSGSGVFLLASVLERFFGLYSAVNSYSRFTARTRRRGILKRWPARIGEQKVL